MSLTTMCSIIQENLQWDLSSLRYIDKDYNYTSPQGTTFLINVCTPLRTELWHVDNPEKVAAVVRTSGGDRSIGCVLLPIHPIPLLY